MATKNFIIKKLSLALIFGVIFFATSSVFALEEGLLVCSAQTATCDDGCRIDPSSAYSINSNGGTTRVGGDGWFINSYNFDGGYSSDMTDDINSAFFMERYGLSNNEVRKIQQKINKLAEVYPSACSSLCEDGRFGNTTIANMAACFCVDAEAAPINGECGPGFESDNYGCCQTEPEICTTTITAPDEFVDGEDINIYIDFSGIGDYTENGIFIIEGGIIAGENCRQNEVDFTVSCEFVIIPGESSLEIEIISPVGRVTYDDTIQCPEVSKTITWGDDTSLCNDNDVEKPLDEDGGCDLYQGDGWVLISEVGDCCVKCDKAPDENNSCEAYGPLWDNPFGGCCEEDCSATECDPGEKPDGCNCVCDPAEACCGIKLNTVVPFIGDCIEMTTQNSTNSANPNSSSVNQLNAFPFLMMGLSKILVTVILIFSFLIVIAAGLMMVTGVYEEGNYKKGMDRVKKVIVALILLGSSGLILKLINPTFFGG